MIACTLNGTEALVGEQINGEAKDHVLGTGVCKDGRAKISYARNFEVSKSRNIERNLTFPSKVPCIYVIMQYPL